MEGGGFTSLSGLAGLCRPATILVVIALAILLGVEGLGGGGAGAVGLHADHLVGQRIFLEVARFGAIGIALGVEQILALLGRWSGFRGRSDGGSCGHQGFLSQFIEALDGARRPAAAPAHTGTVFTASSTSFTTCSTMPVDTTCSSEPLIWITADESSNVNTAVPAATQRAGCPGVAASTWRHQRNTIQSSPSALRQWILPSMVMRSAAGSRIMMRSNGSRSTAQSLDASLRTRCRRSARCAVRRRPIR